MQLAADVLLCEFLTGNHPEVAEMYLALVNRDIVLAESLPVAVSSEVRDLDMVLSCEHINVCAAVGLDEVRGNIDKIVFVVGIDEAGSGQVENFLMGAHNNDRYSLFLTEEVSDPALESIVDEGFGDEYHRTYIV